MTITTTNHKKEIAASRSRSALQISILVAGISTIAAPLVAEILLFPQEPIKNWIILSGMAATQYAASYLILRTRSLTAPRAGFVVTASLFMTLGSSAFALIVTIFSAWSPLSQTVIYARCFLAFVAVANGVFLALSIRYAIAARQECTVLGTIGGMAAALFLHVLHIIRW